jgi:hypothetical protein
MRGLCAVVLTGCIVSQHFGPGVANSSFQAARRDPDPTRDPTKEATQSPWGTEQPAQPGTRRYEVERGFATLAAILAGAFPMLTWYGTFDENLLAPKRARPKPPPRRDEPTPATPRP